ncbi:MAG TPA: hypothetical protein VJ799_13910 [Nitrososphaeraceae archaeon]|nr:hypothetical protein [Nitrososphaeraceae archaeon]
MSDINPNNLLTKILKWLEEEKVYEITTWKNPKAYFSFYVKSKGNRKVPPIFISYPQNYKIKEVLIFGFSWELEEIDKKAFRAIKDENLKIQLFQSIDQKIKKHAQYEIVGNLKNLEGISVYRYVNINQLTKRKVIQNLVKFVLAWGILMNEFKNYGMHGGSFNPSEHI